MRLKTLHEEKPKSPMGKICENTIDLMIKFFAEHGITGRKNYYAGPKETMWEMVVDQYRKKFWVLVSPSDWPKIGVYMASHQGIYMPNRPGALAFEVDISDGFDEVLGLFKKHAA